MSLAVVDGGYLARQAVLAEIMDLLSEASKGAQHPRCDWTMDAIARRIALRAAAAGVVVEI
jgi:hypothetical protein